MEKVYVCLFTSMSEGEPHSNYYLFSDKEKCIDCMINEAKELITEVLENEEVFTDFYKYKIYENEEKKYLNTVFNVYGTEELKNVNIKELYDSVYVSKTASEKEIILLNEKFNIQENGYYLYLPDEIFMCEIKYCEVL